MKDEEIRSTIEQIKAQVKANPDNAEKSDEEIDEMVLDSFYKTYTEGGMTKEDLLGLAEAMGYEPDEGFENDPNAPLQVTPGAEGGEGEGASAPAGNMSESDLEATRTIAPGESTDEFKDKIEDVKEGKPVGEEGGEGGSESGTPAPSSTPAEGGEGGSGSPEEDEEAERKAASELWKMDLSKK